MNHSCICFDSSIIIKAMINEEYSEQASFLLKNAVCKGEEIVMPAFAWAEIGTVLRKKVRLKELDEKDADLLWNAFNELSIIRFEDSIRIRNRAWELAKDESLPTIYDAAFLAVALEHNNETEKCCFWTADEKLYNSINKPVYKKIIKLLSNGG